MARRRSPLWLIIFSDMSTNLMMFFLMLFAMTRMNAQERELLIEGMEKAMKNRPAMEQRQEKQEQERQAIRILEDTIEYGRLKEVTTVEIDPDKIKLTLDIPFFFDSGKASLNPEASLALESLVPSLLRFPHDILIEGHTDNVPIYTPEYQSNWELSVARAVSVINFYVEKGIPAGRFIAGGYGEYHPIALNDTDEDRALNRRIEISILRR